MEIMIVSHQLNILKTFFMNLLLFSRLFILTFNTSAQVRYTKNLDPFIKEYKKIRN
jgi:hypothetical protein